MQFPKDVLWCPDAASKDAVKKSERRTHGDQEGALAQVPVGGHLQQTVGNRDDAQALADEKDVCVGREARDAMKEAHENSLDVFAITVIGDISGDVCGQVEHGDQPLEGRAEQKENPNNIIVFG